MQKKKKLALRKKIIAVASSVMGTTVIVPGFADVDPDAAIRKIFQFVFSVLLIGGIVMLALGIKNLVSALHEGENAPPGAVGKAIGLIISGIVLAASQWIIKAVTGFDATTFSLFGPEA